MFAWFEAGRGARGFIERAAKRLVLTAGVDSWRYDSVAAANGRRAVAVGHMCRCI